MFEYCYEPGDHFGQPHRFIYVRVEAPLAEVDDWCAGEFGPEDRHHPGRWQHVGHSFWFRDAADATLFRIRWG